MRISGAWRACDDQVARPTFWCEMKDASGQWVDVVLLADCGADRTVFSIDVFKALEFAPIRGEEPLAGIGGTAEPLEFPSVLRMRRADGAPIDFRGRFAAVEAESVLDMSVLGRDITNLFALIIDRPGDTVRAFARRSLSGLSREPI